MARKKSSGSCDILTEPFNHPLQPQTVNLDNVTIDHGYGVVRDNTGYIGAENTAEMLIGLRRHNKGKGVPLSPQQAVDTINQKLSMFGRSPIDLETYQGWEQGAAIPTEYRNVIRSAMTDRSSNLDFDRVFGGVGKATPAGPVPTIDSPPEAVYDGVVGNGRGGKNF